MLEISPDNFDQEVLKSSTPVVADFYADWCGPCRTLAPFLEELSKMHMMKDIKICKINTDRNTQIAVEYNIMSIPTILLFKNGKVIAKIVGVHTAENLCDWVKKNI